MAVEEQKAFVVSKAKERKDSKAKLESSVDRLKIMIMYFKTATYRRISIHPLSEFAYEFDCTFFEIH